VACFSSTSSLLLPSLLSPLPYDSVQVLFLVLAIMCFHT
jgi:hypothetical protein